MTASGSPANDNEADSQDTGSEALARMAVRDNGVQDLNEARETARSTSRRRALVGGELGAVLVRIRCLLRGKYI